MRLWAYAELHHHARRVLARLDALEIETLPPVVRDQLRGHRADIEALIAATAPDAIPFLLSAEAHLKRALTPVELRSLSRPH
jgi:hypothetical protein